MITLRTLRGGIRVVYVVALFVGLQVGVEGALLDPMDYPSQGTLTLKSGESYLLSNGTLRPLSSPGMTYQAVNGVFDFDAINAGPGSVIYVDWMAGSLLSGSPISTFLSRGDATFASFVADYAGYGSNEGPGAGGLGSIGFGLRFPHYSGGGGGGYGSAGGAGIPVDITFPNGQHLYVPGGTGGSTYGDPYLQTVNVGSGGGDALNSSGEGGRGGGGIILGATGSITITGTVSANG
ncbi:MAG TPA: hypothetical protein VFT74_04385 [Isosphaeraceae bacterium]|nr:hypothetical protein [Isosphaeraceae bacterium]